MIEERDTPGVIPPPLLLAATFATGLAANAIAPMTITHHRVLRRRAGGLCLLIGAALSASVVRTFGRAATPVSPLRPSRTIVRAGPYQFSRNPDYLGQAIGYTGAALLTNRWWPLLLLPAAMAIVQRTVVSREERYLTRKFGHAYSAYAARVPRWL